MATENLLWPPIRWLVLSNIAFEFDYFNWRTSWQEILLRDSLRTWRNGLKKTDCPLAKRSKKAKTWRKPSEKKTKT